MPFIGQQPASVALTSADITDGIISNAKLAQDIISADTALGATPADTDEFLVSDAGVLKRMDYSHIKGGGKIGQVVTVQNIDTESQVANGNDTFFTIADLTRSITPTATSSKILVISSLTHNHPVQHVHFKLMRDSTDISVGTAAGSRESVSWNFHGASNQQHGASIFTHTWLDSPSTTNAIDYSWKWSRHSTGTLYLNQSESDGDGLNYARTASSITCMEVLA